MYPERMDAKFERLNNETKNFNARNVDRFNPSTRANYNYFDPYKLNAETYKANNNDYGYYYKK